MDITTAPVVLNVDHDDHLFVVDYSLRLPERMVSTVWFTLSSLDNIHASLAIVERTPSEPDSERAIVVLGEVSEPWVCPVVSDRSSVIAENTR
jgi:hypothetical protein